MELAITNRVFQLVSFLILFLKVFFEEAYHCHMSPWDVSINHVTEIDQGVQPLYNIFN